MALTLPVSVEDVGVVAAASAGGVVDYQSVLQSKYNVVQGLDIETLADNCRKQFA